MAELTPLDGLDLWLRLFANHADQVRLSGGWGQVSRYGPEEYGYELMREDIGPTDGLRRSEPWVLAFKIGPDYIVDQTTAHCPTPADVVSFREAQLRLPAFQIWGLSRPNEVAHYQLDEYALFDCWGVRDPTRPIVTMTAAEWAESNDVEKMLRWFRQEWRGTEANLNRVLRSYCLACCRRIWPLLPLPESRTGVEVAERHLRGEATDGEWKRAEYEAEGGAFAFDMQAESDEPRIWAIVEAALRMSAAELAALLESPRPGDDPTRFGILHHAAHFADHAMCYPCSPAESVERFVRFMPAWLLREMVGSPPRFEL